MSHAPRNIAITRFAPSPNGELHLGHAYSALFAYDAARNAGGRFLLRIEDIDTGRSRRHFEDGIKRDLAWLGLEWQEPVRRQSDHFADYRAALDELDSLGVLYPCFCSRKDIAIEIAQSAEAPHGPDGPHYPGTCRALGDADRKTRLDENRPYALRLDVARALDLTGSGLAWRDAGAGEVAATPQDLGDAVLARKDIPTSYHLAVTIDDHLQGVTLVTRGQDLFHATHIHRLLQALLKLETPAYHHHALINDEAGGRLSKRDKSRSLRELRDAGATPDDVREMIDDSKNG